MRVFGIVAALVLAPPVASAEVFPAGVVLESVLKGTAGDLAGLRAGDVLLTWSRSARRPSDANPVEQTLRSPLDLPDIEWAELPLGPVTFRGLRDGRPLTAIAPWEGQGLHVTARPLFTPLLLERYQRGRAFAQAGEIDKAAAAWHDVADRAGEIEGGAEARCWMLGRIAGAWTPTDADKASTAFQDTMACAEQLDPAARAALLEGQAHLDSRQGRYQPSAHGFEVVARMRARLNLVSRGQTLIDQGLAVANGGDAAHAIELYGAAISLLEKEAPESLTLATALAILAVATWGQGNLDAAQALCARSRALTERAAAEGPTMTMALSCEAMMMTNAGDLAGAQALYQRVMEIDARIAPGTQMEVIGRLNLGAAAYERGDLDTSDAFARSALAIVERAPPSSVDWSPRLRAHLLFNLATNALARGDPQAAESAIRAALQDYEKFGPAYVPTALTALGDALSRKGDFPGARVALTRALDLHEKQAPYSAAIADVLTTLGDLDARVGDWSRAQPTYERALGILERLAPAGPRLALVLHGLARVERAGGRPNEAAALLSRATDALEAQRSRLGGSEEARSLFSSRFADIYHDRVETLVALGRTAEAFGVLEKSRARALLMLMAQRDLVLEDVAPPLARELRRVDAEYSRVSEQLGGLNAQKDAADIDRLTLRLHAVGGQQAEVLERIRRASPRLAAFRDPPPLDAEGVRSALDPDTLLLSYSVGEDSTILFVVSHAAAGARAVKIPIGRAQLQARIDAWRRQAETSAPPRGFLAEASSLYDLLLRPAEVEMRARRRVIVCPDGPLHRLPFAALRRDGSYLAQRKAVVIVPSGTVLAQLTRSRSAEAASDTLVAFGDPHASGRDAQLPGSRREVAAIRRVFPRSTAYLGEAATEEQVKASVRDARYVHFACHALVDERLPLQSALALTPAGPGQEASGDGLLHVWEIFERVRIDADLVTLSACRSAAGAEVAGEGLIGLARAFQYAGARSVLASLWTVGDASTVAFMARFYGFLRTGMAKDEALRRAQVDAIRAGHHPVRWAAFQMYGDWRSPAPRQRAGTTRKGYRQAGGRPAGSARVASPSTINR